MRERLTYIFLKRSVHVKPAMQNTELFGWLDLELNTLESFTDDRKRYGLRIALLNFIGTVRWRNTGFNNGRR